MKKIVKKSRLAGYPAWALSLFTLLVLFILLRIGHEPKSTSLSTIQIVLWIFYVILVTVACFIICKTHPKSVWYTPLICNSIYILGLIVNTIGTIVDLGYETTSTEWIIIVSSVILSVSGAIIGARIGRRKLAHQHN